MDFRKVFLDSSFIIAFINKKDKHHLQAKKLFGNLQKVKEVWITDLILCEIGNALSRGLKNIAAGFIENCFKLDNIKLCYVDEKTLKKGFVLYRSYLDKDWGLTDCVSFAVMKEQGIRVAFTADSHFMHAGFEIVLK